MTYKDLCIALLTHPDSPFNMHIWSNFSIDGIVHDLLNMIAYGIGALFKIVLDGTTDFAIGAYKFLSFSESPVVRGLYAVLSDYIWIPVLICGALMCFRLVMGDIIKKNVGKQFIRNLCYLFIAVAILPSIFTYINTEVIDDSYFTEVSGIKSKTSLANDILRTNATDRVWLYNYMANNSQYSDSLNELDAKIEEIKDGVTITGGMAAGISIIINPEMGEDLYYGAMMDDSYISEGSLEPFLTDLTSIEIHDQWKESETAEELTFGDGGRSINQKITEYVHNDWEEAETSDNSEGYKEGIPNLFKIKTFVAPSADSSGIKGNVILRKLSDGTNLLGITGSTYIGKESYWRYDIKWFNVYIELFAHAYVAFVVGYCAIKLIMELIVHQVFGGMMAAMDLSGGDRIKKYFTAIIGCYMGLLIGAMVLPLYTAGCDFITNKIAPDSGFVRALLEIVLAMVIVNVPNMIAMYFGVNTAAGAGTAMFGAGLLLANRARKFGTDVLTGNTTLGRMGANAHQRRRERLADARFEGGQEERRGQAQRSEQRYAEQQTRNAEQTQHARENEQVSDARNEKRDLTENTGLKNISDEAHGRKSDFDYHAEQQREASLNTISAQAEKNGGSRQAYQEAAEKHLKENGAFKPTEKTVAYAADAAKMQREQSVINERAAEKMVADTNLTEAKAQSLAARETLHEWGASDEHLATAAVHNAKAKQMPKKDS